MVAFNLMCAYLNHIFLEILEDDEIFFQVMPLNYDLVLNFCSKGFKISYSQYDS
jgi:hypothetical protein